MLNHILSPDKQEILMYVLLYSIASSLCFLQLQLKQTQKLRVGKPPFPLLGQALLEYITAPQNERITVTEKRS